MRAPLVAVLFVATACVGSFHQRAPAPVAERAPASATTAPAEASSARAPDAAPPWKMIGQSVKGRPLRVATYGNGPRRVLWVGGIHGNEREGAISTAELPKALLATPGGARAVTLTVLEDINPDGAAMNVRGNANGVDLNRNFPAKNFKPNRMYGMSPLSQPESKALHDLIRSLDPHLIIVAHSWSGDHFINYDGPARGLAERFAQLSGYKLRESEDIAATPGSLGSWVGIGLGKPILTLEYLRGRNQREAWLETKNAILAVVLDG